MAFISQPIRWVLVLLALLFASQAFGHGMSDAEKQSIIEGGNLRYLWIGATHMLSGYDHLAFVFGIVFFLTRFKDIVKYITAFTVGHSITLIIATFNGIKINYFLIDAIIALSVCYIAFQNLDGFKKYLNLNSPNMLAMIFGLGLIHGLGLSTRLQQLPLSEDQLLMNIISFNVGIELGQIAALAVMLVVINLFRKSRYFPSFSQIANYALIVFGAVLFLMQMHGYVHSKHPEEFMPTPVAPTMTLSAAQQALSTSSPAWRDTQTIPLAVGAELEFKLKFEKDAVLEYTWKTDGAAVFYDFHGEPAGDTTGYFKSYKTDTSTQASGSLTTPFKGTHGWYWKNTSTTPVVITVQTQGPYEPLANTAPPAPTATNASGSAPAKTHDSID